MSGSSRRDTTRDEFKRWRVGTQTINVHVFHVREKFDSTQAYGFAGCACDTSHVRSVHVNLTVSVSTVHGLNPHNASLYVWNSAACVSAVLIRFLSADSSYHLLAFAYYRTTFQFICFLLRFVKPVQNRAAQDEGELIQRRIVLVPMWEFPERVND